MFLLLRNETQPGKNLCLIGKLYLAGLRTMILALSGLVPFVPTY